MDDGVMWAVSSVVFWPDNLTVGVENQDGSVERVVLAERGGHIFDAAFPEAECCLCGEKGSHKKTNLPKEG